MRALWQRFCDHMLELRIDSARVQFLDAIEAREQALLAVRAAHYRLEGLKAQRRPQRAQEIDDARLTRVRGQGL